MTISSKKIEHTYYFMCSKLIDKYSESDQKPNENGGKNGVN
jgi:hypothetical protein